MKIALHDSEQNNYPNLALMKLSAYHKAKGDSVEWFTPLYSEGDTVYSSKVFTFTDPAPFLPNNTVRGGFGNDLLDTLPEEIEHSCPDYDLYGCKASYGFLTRGCIRDCPWCFVREKEGYIRPHADIEEFARHRDVVLMDNNVLAHTHGIEQIEKIARLNLRVDFNQGLDARLIDDGVAKRLAALKWREPLRLACDSKAQIPAIEKAVQRLRWQNCTPRRYQCYVLIKDVDDALERIKFLKGMDIDPHAQVYMDKNGTPPTDLQLDLERWCNIKSVYKKCTWEKYRKRQSQ